MDAILLTIDGCHVDENDIQHYTFPREAIEELNETYLAIAEWLWHNHPEWQGQTDGTEDEIKCDWDALFEECDRLFDMQTETLPEGGWADDNGVLRCAFPRGLVWDGKDQDKLAFLEWKWHTGGKLEIFVNAMNRYQSRGGE